MVVAVDVPVLSLSREGAVASAVIALALLTRATGAVIAGALLSAVRPRVLGVVAGASVEAA